MSSKCSAYLFRLTWPFLCVRCGAVLPRPLFFLLLGWGLVGLGGWVCGCGLVRGLLSAGGVHVGGGIGGGVWVRGRGGCGED